MRRPSTARKTLGFTPQVRASWADASSFERVPLGVKDCEPNGSLNLGYYCSALSNVRDLLPWLTRKSRKRHGLAQQLPRWHSQPTLHSVSSCSQPMNGMLERSRLSLHSGREP